jgi:predicted nucleic acid-binding protein
MLVVDASAALQACLSSAGFEPLGREQLVAPPLLWSEATSVLHEMLWRREISPDLAATARRRLRQSPLKRRSPAGLLDAAWDTAEELGWAKTYDAEYVALARILRCSLLTIDERLRGTASRVVKVVGPLDL